ncbi:Major facilitator superfamily domain-containing protein [Melia azedarach]|uniref:Major facilitator superfamily domain-containing protein n=1 Tax=Melia azedarach TaxID=155640 RepID=A0ACC1X9B5_MELAZ|nr:Major facilitator superfamily domain-containing protein [Melia azedarach]
MVTMAKDEWVRTAMTDDSVVVELLVRLKQTRTAKSAVAVAALRWGIRQPRSKSIRCDGISRRNKGDSANSMRASPTTPLSWSGGAGGASPSATADEETSRHQTVRSKAIATNETTSNAAKRSRRKKTFAELKEEEGLLLKERINLKKELETLRATFKIQSARNENLKRIKLDLGLDSGKDSSETYSEPEPEKAISTRVHGREVSSREHTASVLSSSSTVADLPESCEAHEAVPARNSLCLLPDLNMMPTDDDSGSETLYGMS